VWTGWKCSGFGNELSEEGLKNYTHQQSVYVESRIYDSKSKL